MVQLKLDHESELTRVRVSSDLRSTADVTSVEEELENTRSAYEERVRELEVEVEVGRLTVEKEKSEREEEAAAAQKRCEELEARLAEMQKNVESSLVHPPSHHLPSLPCLLLALTLLHLPPLHKLPSVLQSSRPSSLHSNRYPFFPPRQRRS